MGTIGYMSPEQARGEPLDQRSDLFSFGVVLYEMATGKQPFSGATSAVVFEAILNKIPARPMQLNPGLPAQIEITLNKALEKDRDLRCQTAAELRADLKRLKRDTDSSRVASVAAADLKEVPLAPDNLRKPRRFSSILVGCGFLSRSGNRVRCWQASLAIFGTQCAVVSRDYIPARRNSFRPIRAGWTLIQRRVARKSSRDFFGASRHGRVAFFGTRPHRASGHLIEGAACALSPDQKWAIVRTPRSPEHLRLLPTGAGEAQSLTNDPINHQWARWFADGKRLVFSGNEPEHGVRLYVQDVSGAKPKPISPEGVDAVGFAVSPDGQSVVGIGPDQKGYLFPSSGGDPRPVNGMESGNIPINWSRDGRSVYLYRSGEVPARIYRVELATGKKTVWKQIAPLDPTGVSTIGPILMTPDGKTYVYGFHRTLGDLYLVEGLK
jgi:hypothetical protein